MRRAVLACLAALGCRSPAADGQAVEVRRSELVVGHATAISAFGTHACALLDTGGVACWGGGARGQLGNGATADSAVPVPVSGLSGAVAVSTGSSYTCALLTGGSVRCWGFNNQGQLGNGSLTSSSVPVPVMGLTDATAIAGGFAHTCAVRTTGQVVCWGSRAAGQGGDGSPIPSAPSLTPVPAIGLTDAISVACGSSHTCAVRQTGAVTCWGNGAEGQLGDGAALSSSTPVGVLGLVDATAVTAGFRSTCARRATGGVSCWGLGDVGQLGNGGTTSSSVPMAVAGLSDAVAVTAAGSTSACALRAGGQIVCWGLGATGQLGNGSFADSPAPVTVTGISGAIGVAGGTSFACALRATGSVACWGGFPWGKAPLVMNTSPVDVPALFGARSVASGGFHGCALDAAGGVSCWGFGGRGQLGNGSIADRATPTPVSNLSDARAVAAKVNFTCALRATGQIACWGDGRWGQLGNGTTTDAASPSGVFGITDATAITTGTFHSCTRRATGQVACWGQNDDGQLGDGSFSRSASPVAVAGLSDAIALAAGGFFTCALRTTGQVACWGRNSGGELGGGAAGAPVPSPVAVSGLTDAIALLAGGGHACAVRAGGGVVCWGGNSSGQLGNGGTTSSAVPVPVPGLSGVVAAEGGDQDTCAVLADGTARCWGRNSRGQLGDGTTVDASLPVAVVGLSDAVAVSPGAYQTCAVRASGAVACWGLEDLTQFHSGTPVTIAGLGDLGLPCAGPAECPSGACVDGVCCDAACGGDDPDDCQACSIAGGAPADGTCATLPVTHACRPAVDACDVAEMCSGAALACPADVIVAPPATCGAAEPGVSVPVEIAGGNDTPGGMSVTFGQVMSVGNVTVTPSTPNTPPPSGYQFVAGTTAVQAWDLSTTAGYGGAVTVCFNYGAAGLTPAQESNLKLMHDDGVRLCPVAGGGMSPWCNITTSVNTTTNVICGVTTSLSPFALMVPLPDTEPPLFPLPPPPTVVAYATSAAGAVVSYAAPTATDAFDGELSATCTPASGTSFSLGKTTVTCTAEDTSGNEGQTHFDVWVEVQAPTDGTFFLPPINADGSSLFKAGSTIPVKFKLTGASAAIADLAAHLRLAKVSAGVTGTDLEAASNGAANEGDLFRYDAGARQYIFNLSTKTLTSGTWSLSAELGDGVTHQINVSLKGSK